MRPALRHITCLYIVTSRKSPDVRVQSRFRFASSHLILPSTHLHLHIALPFSNYLYRMNTYTGTPVNTVWFDAFLSLALGLLAFAGPQAINSVFAMSVTALYIAYAIPIVARFTGDNNFKPGPFTLGAFVSTVSYIALYIQMMCCCRASQLQ